MSSPQPLLLMDTRSSGAPRWFSVDDRVMGGRSVSRMSATAEAAALFQGRVSLEDGGGFASVRAEVEWPDLSRWSGLTLAVRGDGHRFRLRLWVERGMDRVSWQAGFGTRAGEWMEVTLPFPLFAATLRGRPVPGAPPLDLARLQQVGLMVADRQEGEFRLELRSIRAV